MSKDNEKYAMQLLQDYRNAEEAKNGIDEEIVKWNELYEGKRQAIISDPNEPAIEKIVAKEIAKQVEKQNPVITEAFLSKRNPVVIETRGDDQSNADIENWINDVLTDPEEYTENIEEIVEILMREGTVWTKASWDRDVDSDGNMVENKPSLKVCLNENVLPDPKAKKQKDMRFLIEVQPLARIEIAILLNMDIEKIEGKARDGHHKSALRESREIEYEDLGYKEDTTTVDEERDMLELITYYGYVVENNKKKYIIAYWVNGQDDILKIEENDIPGRKIPFYKAVYSRKPGSLWGRPLAYFLEDNQRIKTGIKRGFLETIEIANHGQQFILKGGIDYLNYKKLLMGKKYITLNKQNALIDGQFKPLPASIMQYYELEGREATELSGNKGFTVNAEGIAKEGKEGQLTSSQQRTSATVRSISAMLSGVVRQWLYYGQEYLTIPDVLKIINNKETSLDMFLSALGQRIVVYVGTEESTYAKVQQLNMLMQQVATNKDSLPDTIPSEIVAEMFEAFDKREKARAIRSYKPEPSPQQTKMLDLQMMETQAKIAKTNAETQAIPIQAQAELLKGKAKMLEGQTSEEEKIGRIRKDQNSQRIATMEAMSKQREEIAREDVLKERKTNG